MKKTVAFVLSVIMAFMVFSGCLAESKTTSLHDYIFNMWLDDSLLWKETFFSEHNTFTREEIEPYPEDSCWIVFVPDEGMVRLCGKKSNGTWVATIWNDFTFNEMMYLCMGMCMTWETYEKIGIFGIMFWDDDATKRMYVTNNDGAKAFLEFYKQVFNIED